jgi:hypothetical protein
MQAADFLAIEDHIQDTCNTLARRLFAVETRTENRGMFEVMKQVLMHTPVAGHECS